MILGIVGGIGSGKSTVARLFAEAGCPVVDADGIAHGVLREPAVRDRLRARFGSGIFGPDGEVDRREMAAAAFGSGEGVSALNEVVHPRVREEILEIVGKHLHDHSVSGAGPPGSVLVLDVSLLASSPLRHRCDRFVFVDAAEEIRRRRCRERGWAPGELERRERHQASLADKRALAHWVIDNSGSLEATRAQVLRLLEEIEAGSGAQRPPNFSGRQ